MEKRVKIGTQPALVIFDNKCVIKKGKMIRFRKAFHGSKWESGIITDINSECIFIDKM